LPIKVWTSVAWTMAGLAWPAMQLLAQPAPAPSAPSSAPAAQAAPASPPQECPPAPTSDDSRPWASGVSESEQAIALDLYNAGNDELVESRFAQALAKYREAIRHWDHPAIRYNMAVCLMQLGQLVEARDSFERSVAYGRRPLEADKCEQAVQHRKDLEAQLAVVEISAWDRGTDVMLDGTPLLKAPATSRRFVLPGPHQVVATRPGFLTLSRTINLGAGKLARHVIVPTLELVAHEIRPALEIEAATTTPGAPAAGAAGAAKTDSTGRTPPQPAAPAAPSPSAAPTRPSAAPTRPSAAPTRPSAAPTRPKPR
jgi:hypothetical protein